MAKSLKMLYLTAAGIAESTEAEIEAQWTKMEERNDRISSTQKFALYDFVDSALQVNKQLLAALKGSGCNFKGWSNIAGDFTVKTANGNYIVSVPSRVECR